MELTLSGIMPFVRYVHYIELVPAFTSHPQIAYDHRIFLCVNGLCEITALDTNYKLSANSMLFVPSGVKYRLHETENNALLAGINFDFMSFCADKTVPIVPACSVDDFSPGRLLEEYAFSDIAAFNAPFVINNSGEIYTMVKKMLDEYTVKRLFYREECAALLRRALICAARSIMSGFSPTPKNTADIVINYIAANYKRRLSNEIIGSELHFHPNYLNRIMLLSTGKSLHKYLLDFRLNKALDLLQTTPMKITDIAYSVGFTDVWQFCKYFKAQTGQTPGSFR